MIWVFGLFVALPLVEIALFIKVGGLIGLLPTLALIIGIAIFGTWLVRSQGTAAWLEMQRALAEGRDPSAPLADGAAIFAAGILMMVPGFFTDLVGLILLIPAVRGRAVRALASRVRLSTPPRRAPYGTDDAGTIDGTYTEVRRDPSLPPSGWSRH